MKINTIVWKEAIVDKIEIKHKVMVSEVEEVLRGSKRVYRIARGKVKGEDVYLSLGKTGGGRYLSVFFILKKNCTILPISARDMDDKERRRYRNE